MFSGLSGIGRAYKKLPPHHNYVELASNIEKLANHLLDSSLGSFSSEGYVKAPDRWEWKLGNDLKMLLENASSFVWRDHDRARPCSRSIEHPHSGASSAALCFQQTD
jgi:hypothetical protein